MQTFTYRTNWSLGEWQSKLAYRFKHVNQQRRPLETFAILTEMATGVTRGIRESDSDVLKRFMPRFLAWFLGMSTQLEVNLERAVYDSFPGVCPYCRQDSGCTCKVRRQDRKRLSDPDEIKRLQANFPCPRNLDEWAAMFQGIYGDMNEVTGNMGMVGHFMEELGEVCEIIRFHLATDKDLAASHVKMSKDNIKHRLHIELSDLFAWYCGLIYVAQLDVDVEMKGIYGTHCPECLKPFCECSPYRVHDHVRLGAKELEA